MQMQGMQIYMYFVLSMIVSCRCQYVKEFYLYNFILKCYDFVMNLPR
jgi:hypothetical protein